MRYGDPDFLQDYRGPRDYEALANFSQANLGPACGPQRLELCDSGGRWRCATAWVLHDKAVEL